MFRMLKIRIKFRAKLLRVNIGAAAIKLAFRIAGDSFWQTFKRETVICYLKEYKEDHDALV